ncbi:MAG: hypothetical protein ACUVWN_14725 [bacterium]
MRKAYAKPMIKSQKMTASTWACRLVCAAGNPNQGTVQGSTLFTALLWDPSVGLEPVCPP